MALIHQIWNKADLATIKSNVGRLDFDKLETITVDLSKLSNVVKNDLVKKSFYDESIKKANAIY